jgi:two-component system, NarL family, nitrate/nitrite response regulator NarL
MNELRLLIIADNPLARAGLATLLGAQPGFFIAGQLPAHEDIAAAVITYLPDVLVWDLGWDPVHALEQLDEVSGDAPPIIALLADQSDAVAAWSAGAAGLVPRDVEAESLAAAVAAAAQGMAVFEATVAATLLPVTPLSELDTAVELTGREREVLQLLAEGLPNKTIARRLAISEHTVKFHVNAILSKLGAQSRTEAVVRATRLGLILL